MTIYKRMQGGIEVACDAPGCSESYVQETFGTGAADWTTVEPPGMADPRHYCPEHSPPDDPDA